MRSIVTRSQYAFLRGPAKSIVNGLSQDPHREKPNPTTFFEQYAQYVEALKNMGLETFICDPDEKFPDGNFVEDTHLVLDGKVIIELNPGAASRAGEPMSLRASLEAFLPTNIRKCALSKQFTIDGGDILEDRKTLYVGLSRRTQQGAIDELADIVKMYDYQVCSIQVPEGLHLKSGMTCILPGHFIIQESFQRILDQLKAKDPSIQYFIVPPEEDFAANVLPINGKIMIPTGCPQAKAYISQYYAPADILEVDTSQARLVDGALTCSSLVI